MYIDRSGECQCKSVKFDVKGQVMLNALCHCGTCCYNRSMSPVHVMVVKFFESLTITEGEENLSKYETETAEHGFCSICGVMVYQTLKEKTEGKDYVTIMPTNFHIENKDCKDGRRKLPEDYLPQLHINYQERHYDWSDDLPKCITWPPGTAYPFGGMCDNNGVPLLEEGCPDET